MRSPFESVTRVAISEILHQHGQQSKYGLVLTDESLRDIVDEIFTLLLTSRNLKSAGDRILGNLGNPSGPQNRPNTKTTNK
jgi:hypothetical protein